MQVANRQTREKYGGVSASKIIGESVVQRKNEDLGKIHERVIDRVEYPEGKAKRIIGTLTLAAGFVLLAGVPSMAADARRDLPDEDPRPIAGSASGIVNLEFLDIPQVPRQEKPKPKRRDPGRQNPSAPESICVNAGFLGNLFGALVGLDLGCDNEEPLAR